MKTMTMKTTLIKNAKIVNEGTIFSGDILIEGEYIKQVAASISKRFNFILHGGHISNAAIKTFNQRQLNS